MEVATSLPLRRVLRRCTDSPGGQSQPHVSRTYGNASITTTASPSPPYSKHGVSVCCHSVRSVSDFHAPLNVEILLQICTILSVSRSRVKLNHVVCTRIELSLYLFSISGKIHWFDKWKHEVNSLINQLIFRLFIADISAAMKLFLCMPTQDLSFHIRHCTLKILPAKIHIYCRVRGSVVPVQGLFSDRFSVWQLHCF